MRALTTELFAALTVSCAIGCGGQSRTDPGGSGGVGATGGGATGGSGGSGNAGGVGAAGGCVVASGHLPVTSESVDVAGPAVARTDAGFVIAWREISAIGNLRVSTATLSPDGVFTKVHSALSGQCVGEPGTNDVSLSFRGAAGLLATAIPSCGQGAGSLIAEVDPNGFFGDSTAPKNAAFDELVTKHQALAPAAAPGEWEFVYVVSKPLAEAQRVVLTGASFKSVPLVTVASGAKSVQVATSPTTRAQLVVRSSGSALLLENNEFPAQGTPAEYPLPESDATSVAAWTHRGLGVVVDQGALAWTAATPVTLIATGTLPHDAVLPRDLVSVHVAEQDGALHLVAGAPKALYLGQAFSAEQFWLNGVPDRERRVDATEVPELSGFDGARSGAAVRQEKIAVAWLTSAKVAAGEPIGGWALMSCP